MKNKSREQATEPLSDDLADFASEIARHSKGRTEVFGADASALTDLLLGLGIDASVVDRQAAEAHRRDLPRTVIVSFASGADADGAALHAAWARLGDKGTMITCAPNPDADGAQEATFGLAGLRDLVRPFGRTRMQSSQPFRWLMSVNEKGVSMDRNIRRRIEVTADLCRGSVLELGSGAGHLSAAIAARGLPVRGLELARGKVATARSLYPHITFEQGDILALEDGSASHDTVIIAEVLEHVPEEVGRRMTDIAWSLLAPGGRLIVSVPYQDLIPHRNHVREFTRSSLERELSRYGTPHFEMRQPLRWLLMYVDKAG